MYSTSNEGKSVVAERFIRILKDKIFKHMKARTFILMCLAILLITNEISNPITNGTNETD